ncbi:toxin glutamine deamidase domain-containing protein [Amycolatopsis sp. NPDC051758]|uniref:toxin glutamine deamidase domain-containing protein n=1 Tax=Amycolatopsis sp. NPDC051758 TaxID=3363935 RepID=UPI0037B198F3
MTESKIKDCAEVAGQVAVGAAALAALFAVWGAGTAEARPIPVDAVDGSPAPAAPKPAPKAPVKAETPKESADRETRKFENDISRDQKQQQEKKSDDDRETRKFENDISRDQKQQKKESDERKSDEDRENRKFRNDVDRDEKHQQKEKEKEKEDNEDADRENRKFRNDIDRDARQQEKEKEAERKSDDERENRKFRNQIVQDREADARRKDADRENDRFLAQVERDRPKDTTPNGTTRSVKAWETAQQVAKDAGAARATAYDLAATRNKGATGSVRAWETTAQLADEAELAAQKLEYVRDVGLPQTPLPPASFKYNRNVTSPNYGGDAAETIEGVDWQRFPGAPGGIPVGFTKDGSKVVVVKDPITPEAPLSPEMMKYLGAGNFVERGVTADGSTVLVLHPRTHIDDSADDLAAQWDNVVNGRIEGPDDVGRAVGGTIALTLDRTIGLGQGDLYGAGKKCQDTGDCGDSVKEGGLAALSVVPVGRAAGLVGKGAAATGRLADRVLPPAITAIPGRAVDGASTAFAAAKASPIATYVPDVARAGAAKVKDAAARVPLVQTGAALVRPVAASVLPKAQRAFDVANKVPPIRYALYQHNVDNTIDEFGRVKDCVEGDGCGPAATGAGLLAFDLAKGRGLTDAYRDAPGCADGHTYACVMTGLDALAAPSVNRPAKTSANGAEDLQLPGAVNDVRGKKNCVSCAIAGDSTLAGHPASAIKLDPDEPIPDGLRLIQQYAGSTWYAVSGRASIERRLLTAGEGARAIVYGGNGRKAHVWNAIVQGGRVNFVDFQGVGRNGPAAFDPWKTFYFVRTN